MEFVGSYLHQQGNRRVMGFEPRELKHNAARSRDISPEVTGVPTVQRSLTSVSQPSPEAVHPILSFTEQGQHTPGFCLDRVATFLNEEERTAPGLKVILQDGTTTQAASIWKDIRTPQSVDDLASGYLINRFPAKLAEILPLEMKLPTPRPAFDPNSHPSVDEALTITGLLSWLNSEQQLLKNSIEERALLTLLRPGLEVNDNLYLYDHGVRLARGRQGYGRLYLEPVTPGERNPRGFGRRKYVRGWPLGEKTLDHHKLLNDTREYLSKFSPQEIWEKVFNIELREALGPALRSCDQAVEQIRRGFEQHFRVPSERTDHLDGAAAFGIVAKMPSGDLLLMNVGDTSIALIHDRRLVFLSDEFHPYRAGACRIGIEYTSAGWRTVRPKNASAVLVPEDIARESKIVLCSDGVASENFPEPRHKILEQIASQDLTSGEILVSLKNAALTQEDLLKRQFAQQQRTFPPDDKSAVVLEGWFLY